ncbi:lysophospholipase L1-like esterase [Murinocardiopsis flavida]|uniref:Lysophospholipase L1-like esterase n=1 Tax=Murinocardiopsis flavida TaxID=645275 RepID=A0A2P8D2A1_9ACTN|nr:SGNH/GDSL hydrolase family protein [Murinocardiopsis flavida]PSK91337.1 lysophospholipase L1-like esterase [Murinocardiopsis flavida]
MSRLELAGARLSYVAVGDSFTEGVGDPAPDDAPLPGAQGGVRGWADRFAEHLAAHAAELRYANLAVRGKLLRQVMADQVPRAAELRPDLVTFSAGGNDLLRPGADPDRLAAVLESGVRRLRDSGAQVVLFTGVNVARGYMRPLIGGFTRYYLNIRAIADRHDCLLVDQWSMAVLADPRAWDADRLHMSPEGHRRLALKVCDVVGVPTEGDWAEPWPPAGPTTWRAERGADLRWMREFLGPWVNRRLTGRSSGDGRRAKRPEPVVLPGRDPRDIGG